MKLSPLALAQQSGGVASIPQYLRDGFEMKYFPRGIAFADLPVPVLADLPRAEVEAFSIDDDATTEVDDALSLTRFGRRRQTRGHTHCRARAGHRARQRHGKNHRRAPKHRELPRRQITMLPENWIAAFSLDAGGYRPAVSIYFDVDADFNVSAPGVQNRSGKHRGNLRIQAIEPHFNAQSGLRCRGRSPVCPPPRFDLVYQFGHRPPKKRAANTSLSAPRNMITASNWLQTAWFPWPARERGSPIDTLVSEMMILANSTWAQMLDQVGLPGLFRVQPAAKCVMSTQSEPHIGMGVQHYGWFTSPLRRAADYINQKQLISLIDPQAAPLYQKNDADLFAALRDFDTAYSAYADFQRQMEAYWSLVYLQQQGIKELTATLLKDDLVRIDGLPMVARASGIPFDALPRSQMKVAVAEVDADKQFIALNYLKAVAPPNAA